MRILIVEDELTSRIFIQEILSAYGECELARDGEEAIQFFLKAHETGRPFDLICMDIMMPKIDGQEALKGIRGIEKEKGIEELDQVKVIMVSALEDQKNVIDAFYRGRAASYIIKPIEKEKLLDEVRKLGLIP